MGRAYRVVFTIVTCVVVSVAALATPSMAAAPDAAAANGIKWHPGHYVALDGILRVGNQDSLSATHQAQIAQLRSEPTIKGVKIFVQWSALEGARPGDYAAGVALIQKYVDWVTAAGKQLWISFLHTQFGGYDPNNPQAFFPNYIVTDPAYGLTRLDNDRGIMARIWQQATMDRIIAQSAYYADRFDPNPRVEAIQIDETAIGITEGIDGFSNANVVTQYKRFYQAARVDWPNTGLRLTANYISGDQRMIDLISSCVPVACAIGGPDVIPSEDIQANRVFAGETGGVDYRGTLPFVAEIQSPELCGHEGCWTPKQLYDHAMYGNTAAGIRATQPRYFMWYRNTYYGGDPQKWATGILPFIRSINGAVYSTACPGAYPACITT